MELSPSSHIDTFCRDNLPPFDQWPTLLLDRPEFQYPDRLNCASDLLDGTIARYGAERPAVLSRDGDVWTYETLRDHADRVAHVLTGRLGVVPGNRVLLLGQNSPWLAACWLGVVKAGAVVVTAFDAQRPRELAAICEIAQPRHAICDVSLIGSLSQAREASGRRGPGLSVTTYGGSGADDLWQLTAHVPGHYPAVRTAADDVAILAFTSGTTGQPKGCMHFHRDVLAIADTFSTHVLGLRPTDVCAGSPPMGFLFGLDALLTCPLRAGASTLLCAWAGVEEALADISRHRVSTFFTAPTAYRAMLGQIATHDISSLRLCVSGGEDLPASTWHAWQKRTGLPIVNVIGSTEMLGIFMAVPKEANRPGVTGVPVPGFEARLVDPDGSPVPSGQQGLLAVCGPTGCRYLADDRQRQYVRQGWNITGDVFTCDSDGYFHYVSRADDLIISAGCNVAGCEVEEILLGHPDVLEAAVFGQQHDDLGQLVVAHVVLREGTERGERTEAALRRWVMSELAPYKCPQKIVFRDQLPRTLSGKLQRYRLRTGESL